MYVILLENNKINNSFVRYDKRRLDISDVYLTREFAREAVKELKEQPIKDKENRLNYYRKAITKQEKSIEKRKKIIEDCHAFFDSGRIYYQSKCVAQHLAEVKRLELEIQLLEAVEVKIPKLKIAKIDIKEIR